MVVCRVAPYALLLSFAFNACSGSEPPAEAERDLTLPPAESIAVISDEPLTEETLTPTRDETPIEQPEVEHPAPAKQLPAPQEPPRKQSRTLLCGRRPHWNWRRPTPLGRE